VALSSPTTSHLLTYPHTSWSLHASARWLALCEGLQTYEPSPTTLTITDPARRWEIVSAYQKSVRRGIEDVAQQLVGAMVVGTMAEHRYFWTRVTTTACEDVGYGDPELMRFVTACSQLYSPSVGREKLARVWGFLTHEMCTTRRSRIFCQLSLLEDFLITERLTVDGLTEWELNVLAVIRALKNRDNAFWSADPETAWLIKNNWRGQNMLKFMKYAPHGGILLQVMPSEMTAPPWETLVGLPDFCYDMHTRVGKRTIVRLSSLPIVKNFYVQHPTPKRPDPIGWALFLLEGALVPGGLADVRLSALEHKFLARKFNWSMQTWVEFQTLMHRLLFDDKAVNDLRREVLAEAQYT
jgi:hypothetical protein